MDKLSGFDQLKGLKKELEAKENPQKESKAKYPVKVVPKKRDRKVKVKDINEEHARNDGILRGQAVRMMDTNDEGTITGFRKDCYEITFPDGFMVTATKGEFILVNKEEDSMLYKTVSSLSKKKEKEKQQVSSSSEPLVVDLHLERIPGNEMTPEWAALEFQIDYFKRILRGNLKHRGMKIVFIHGFGDGRLKDAIRKELDEVFAQSCSYQPGTSDNYGNGTVIVTIR